MPDPAPVLRSLLESMPNAVLSTDERFGEASARLAPERLPEALRLVRDKESLACDVLLDLTAVDRWLPGRDAAAPGRFEVVYQLGSTRHRHRLRLAVEVGGDPAELDSAVPLWPAADWLEREVFDLYGIRFRRHPRLRRLLLEDDFEGHPLRRDHPRAGHPEG